MLSPCTFYVCWGGSALVQMHPLLTFDATAVRLAAHACTQHPACRAVQCHWPGMRAATRTRHSSDHAASMPQPLQHHPARELPSHAQPPFHTHMHVHTHARARAHTRAYTHTRMRTHTHATCTHACTRHAHRRTRMRTPPTHTMRICMVAHAHACTCPASHITTSR